MKYFLIVVFNCILRIIYFPIKCLVKKQNKIVYLSRQSDNVSMDMEMLSCMIANERHDIKQVFRLKMIKEGVLSKILYFFWMIGDMYHIAGAKVAICDTYSIPVSCLKHKKGITIIQIWHSMGALKKFGWQSIGKSEGRSKKMSLGMHMHENYDYVLAPSKETGVFYSKAFRTSIDKIKYLTLPHIDYILDGQNRKAELEKYYDDLTGKKLVVYVPTFRNGEEEIVRSIVKEFENDEEIKLLISLHPLSKISNKNDYAIKGELTSFDLMKMADVIITDYSACAFEASLLSVPLYFYVPDYDTYMECRGVNIDLSMEMSNFFFRDVEELHKSITDGCKSINQVKMFAQKYVENVDECTVKLTQFIIEMI